MFDVYIDDVSLYQNGFYIIERPEIPAPKKRYKEFDIKGRNGKMYQDTGFYEDVEIEIDFNYLDSEKRWNAKWRDAKKIFLNAIGKKLIFSDDKSVYYKIKKIEISTNERASLRIGRFSVSFTLDPFIYLVAGLEKYDSSMVLINQYEECKPIYHVVGEGVLTLEVNGSAFVANVGQNIIIDTDRKISYRENGELENVKVTGDYEDICLKNGSNAIDVSDGFEVLVQPNWRTL